MASARTEPLAFSLATAAELLLLLRFSTPNVANDVLGLMALTLALYCVTWAVYRMFIYSRFVSTLRHLPTAKSGIPLIGWGPSQFSQNRGQVFLQMSKAVPNDGLIRFHGFLDREHLLLTSPQAISEVLVKRSYDFIKPPGATKIFNRFLGSTFLLLTEGIDHRELKRNMQPSFNLTQVERHYPMFWSRAVHMTNAKGSEAMQSEGTFVADVGEWAHDATLDSIVRALFGENFDDSPHKSMLPQLDDIVVSPSWDVQVYFTMTAFLPLWTLKLIPGGVDDRMNAASFRLRKAVGDFLEERRKSDTGDSKDVAIQLMNRRTFTDEELVSNVLGLIMAGIEPTSASFTWTIWYLSKHPTWQARLRDEIRAQIPHRFFSEEVDKFDAFAVLENLPILDAVCNESLRLMPPAPTSNRIAKSDTTILGCHVPANTKLFISPYITNRSEAFWGPTAEEFDPGRWLEEGGWGKDVKNGRGGAATPSHYSFMPFLHGPRKCIGHIYAQAEIRSFLAAFIGKFEFEMADASEEVIPAGVLTAKPKNGMRLRLRPVDSW